MFLPILPSRVVQNASLKEALTTLGLTTNLKLVLDAGDVESWPGNGQKWLDRAGGGYDFYLGADGSVGSTDPTFNGNVGNQGGEYFSSDGGDYFTYDSANEAWMKDIGKPGSGTCLAIARIASDAFTRFFNNQTNTASNYGFSFNYDSNFHKFTVRSIHTSTDYQSLGGAGPDVSSLLPMLAIVSIAWTFAADGSRSYTVNVNGTNYNGSGGVDGTLPWSTNDPAYGTRLLASGDVADLAPNGSRLYGLAIWQGTKLSDANLTAIWGAIRSRYGL